MQTRTNPDTDSLAAYSEPVNIEITKLSKVFTLRDRANPNKPGRTVSVTWDERLPLIKGFANRYSYVVRFGKPGDVAANHFHKKKQELYYALHGEFKIILEDVQTNKREELTLKDGDNRFIHVPANVAHVVISQTTDDALLVIANHPESLDDEFPYELA